MNPFSFSSARGSSSEYFDDRGTFAPDHLPKPGPFLTGQDVLTGDEHVSFHEVTRDCFEERGVYDATFGYNLATLNRDRRHPDAGYRYALEVQSDAADADEVDPDGGETGNADVTLETPDDYRVLRAEFTPTTEFCPQGSALTTGSFRAWNGLADRHEFDLVRVRVHPDHYQAEPINAELAALEQTFLESGTVPDGVDPARDRDRNRDRASPF